MTLPEYQKQVADLVKRLGFEDENVPDIFMLLTEEVGEFAKAARKSQGLKTHKGSKEHDVAEEAADVFLYLLDLCNHLGIDLEEAIEAKIVKNQEREWS